MSNTNDGGPAFPFKFASDSYIDQDPIVSHGMSLRDWFAGQALVAIIARKNPEVGFGGDILSAEDINPRGTPVNKEGDRTSYDLFKRWGPTTAYDIADAMIAARERTTT